jgi:sulfur carrier protein
MAVTIILNGETRELPTGTSVATLIEMLKLSGRLAAERNGEIVPRSAHASTILAEGDRVEIVRAIGGG